MHLDVSRIIGAVTRVVTTKERDGRAARVVVATRTYATDIDDLWDALTTAERIGRWLTPVEGELRLGGRYQLQGNASGTITTCDAPRHLAVTWEFGGQSTWVDVRLEVDGDGTRLELEHAAHVDDDKWREFGPGAVGIGWDLSLGGLDMHIAGTDRRLEDAMAWFGSENGQAFMRGSGDGWRDAHLASGEDREQVIDAAKRCATAYGLS